MQDTKIRWSDDTWNAMTGCTKISPGCDHCYAETIAEKFRGTAFPNGFEPTFKPQKLRDAAKLLKRKGPRRIFVNSMSDVHHETWTWDQIAAIYDAALETPEHDYLVLTKRPERMARFFLGHRAVRNRTDDNGAIRRISAPHVARKPPAGAEDDGWLLEHEHEGYLAMNGLDSVPASLWLGTTIESDRYVYRADWLRTIPVPVRFLSCEPLIGPVPSLDLDGIGWVIAGGESGPGYRPCPHEWGYDLRDRCAEAEIAFYWKQSAAPRTEMGIELDGRRHEEYPYAHPALGQPRVVGRHLDEAVIA